MDIQEQDGQKFVEQADGSRVQVYDYPKDLPEDFVKVNEGVPGQVGLGQINSDSREKSAQAEAAEEVKTTKPAKKKGRK